MKIQSPSPAGEGLCTGDYSRVSEEDHPVLSTALPPAAAVKQCGAPADKQEKEAGESPKAAGPQGEDQRTAGGMEGQVPQLAGQRGKAQDRRPI